MIKIKLSKEERKEIEELHWNWFEKRHKKGYADIKNSLGLTSDDEVKKIIIGEKKVLERYRLRIGKKKDEALEKKYDLFSNGTTEWGAYQLCEKLGVDVCPYCNRQYIFTVSGRKTKITRPEMDHFYNKSDYPYLSCSLYNLIPSCHICNHVKSDNVNEIIYPYEEEFGSDAKFCIRYKQTENIDLQNPLDVKNIEIFFKNMFVQRSSFDCKKCRKIMNSVAVFHLKDIYNHHRLDLNDLLKRYRNYSKPKINDILKMIIKANGKFSENDIEMILRLYSKQIKEMILGIPLGAGDRQYPFRKFKEDIVAQLDNADK